MKLILPAVLLAITLSLCNLSEKFKGTNANQSNVGSSANTNSANSQANSDAVLKELTELKNKWKAAGARGDLLSLQQILADEFTNSDENGKTYNKAEWVKLFKGGTTLKSWTLSDEKLVNFDGDTATMTVNIRSIYPRGRERRVIDTDKFVKRDGRWQVVASQSTLLK
jgi:hypothetical protein